LDTRHDSRLKLGEFTMELWSPWKMELCRKNPDVLWGRKNSRKYILSMKQVERWNACGDVHPPSLMVFSPK